MPKAKSKIFDAVDETAEGLYAAGAIDQATMRRFNQLCRADRRVTRNSFRDLGFSPDEAAALQIRCKLAAALERQIARKCWSPAVAARVLKTPRVSINRLAKGDIERFSIDALIRLTVRAGLHVELIIR